MVINKVIRLIIIINQFYFNECSLIPQNIRGILPYIVGIFDLECQSNSKFRKRKYMLSDQFENNP